MSIKKQASLYIKNINFDTREKRDKNLIQWLVICQYPIFVETASVLNEFRDPENWYLYKGRIKPGLFREIVKNPKLRS